MGGLRAWRAVQAASQHARFNPMLVASARRRQMPYGDPFLGGLIGKAAGFLVPKIGGLFRGASRAGVLAPGGPMAVLPGAGAVGRMLPGRLGRMARGLGGVAAAGGAFEAGSRLVGGALGPSGERAGFGAGRRYRRIDVGNIKALRRACRRVTGFRDLARQTVVLASQVKCRPAKKGKRCR